MAQANAYMNATWAIAVAEAATVADELLVADCDLDLCRQGKDKMFNFAAHRRPAQYGLITERTGAILPEAR
jgi:hypothetical protein